MFDAKRIRQLEEENELLRYRIEQYEESFGVKDDIAPLQSLGFRPSEARILNLLLRKEFVTRRQMVIALYAHDPERAFEARYNLASVHLAHIRPKLARLGIALSRNAPYGETRMHRYLSPADRARLQQMVAAEAQELARRASLKQAA